MTCYRSVTPACIAVLLLMTVACSKPDPQPAGNAAEPAQPAGAGDQALFLKQGLDADDRQSFYYLPQGSQLLPYYWFLALEQADSQALFRSDAHMTALGYIPQPAEPRLNPDGLPIGFARDDNPDNVNAPALRQEFLGNDFPHRDLPATNAWLGLTCAACHTLELRYQDHRIRIDGGPAMADHERFLEQLAQALAATWQDQQKMDRFAQRILAANWSQPEQQALQARVKAYSAVLDELAARNRSELAYGNGRLDAFGAILNRVTETGLGIPANHQNANAPVSFPQLWNSSRLSWVQWNSATGSPLRRNTGQVIGVYGQFQLSDIRADGLIDSSMRLENLDRLEGLVQQMRAPPWPERVFGQIDHDKAAQGRVLYAQNCRRCHVIRDADGQYPLTPANPPGHRFIKTVQPPLAKLRTDPQMVDNFLHHQVDPGLLRPYLPNELRTRPQVPAKALLLLTVDGMIEHKLQQTGLQGEQLEALRFRLNGSRLPPMVNPGDARISTYRARPLDGIWASAPFLHNGSVPNLYQLLLPEQQRQRQFRLGGHDFDPVRVGIDSRTAADGFEFDASLPGNLNSGHSGPHFTRFKAEDGHFRDFSDAQRWALIEYLKTL